MVLSQMARMDESPRVDSQSERCVCACVDMGTRQFQNRCETTATGIDLLSYL